MLPLQPIDYPELSTEQESLMAQDLAESIATYCFDELMGQFTDFALDILRQNGIDPATPLGYDLTNDLLRRIKITAQ